MRIDTHQHFWRYDPQRYAWIEPGSPLARDFAPEQLRPELAAAGVSGTLLVEARGHLEETERLLRIAEAQPFALGVVGWLPLVDAGIEGLVERYGEGTKLRAVRNAIAFEPDPDYMFRPDFNRGIVALARRDLTYDLLFTPDDLSRAPRFVDRHPNQRFVLDHLAKPLVREGRLEPWKREIVELARRQNVYCKLSGLVTEADPERWKPADLAPYLDTVLEAFTPERLMFGSDWPVVTLATTYGGWVSTLQQAIAPLSAAEKARIWAGTAREAYALADALPALAGASTDR